MPSEMLDLHPDDTIHEFFDGVVGLVEASSHEKYYLWDRYADEPFAIKYGPPDRTRYSWVDKNSGFLPRVGYLDGRPICISVFTAVVDGKKLLFWHATSQVVDYELIDRWFKKYLPVTAFRDGDPRGYLNQTDPTNFCNILR